MALELTQANQQIQHFLQLAKSWPLNIEPFLKAPPIGNVFSLSTQLKTLRDFEKRNELNLDEATSGESSPCQSDSERNSRAQMPSLLDVCELLTDELSLELDESLDKFRNISGKGITLLFENFDINFRIQRLYGFLRNIRVNDYSSDRIFSAEESRMIVFRESTSIIMDFSIKRHELLFEYFMKLEAYLREETRRPIKISRVIGDKKSRGQFYAAIIRNLPPKVTKKEIVTQCQREASGQIVAGTLLKIKTRYCCMLRFDSLDEAEVVCKRLNNFSLRDPQTNEKYVLKAHIHPESSSRTGRKEAAMFPDVSQRRERAEFDKTSAQENLTGINELRDIFMKSKKPSIPEKPKPPDTLRRNISAENILPPLGEADNLLQRFYSNQVQSTESMLIERNGDNGHSELTKLMQSTITTQEQRELRGLEGNNRMEEEANRQYPNYEDRFGRRSYRSSNLVPLTIVKESDNKDKKERSSSRSTSKYRKQSPQKYSREDRYPHKRHDFHHKRNWEPKPGFKKERERSKSRSKSKRSISKSRTKSGSPSRSRSRSRSKSPSKRHTQYKKRRNKYEEDPKRRSRSRSKEKRKYMTKRSNSRSESRSKRNDKEKESPKKNEEKFEKKDKESDNDEKRSRSSSKKVKTKRHNKSRSRSRSIDRKKYYDKHKNYPQRDHKRSYNDHHKTSYKRDYDSKYNNYQSDRRSHHHKSHRDYDDRKKKGYRDHEKDHKKHKRRNRSRSRSSRSRDKSSRSRSRSIDHDAKKRRSNERNNRHSPSKEQSETVDIKRENAKEVTVGN